MATDRAPFPTENFKALASAEAGHWWFRARNRAILWCLSRHSALPGRILEVGCGTGFVLHALAGAYPRARLFATEYFEEGLDYARIRVPQASFQQLDARAMDDSSAFDLIGAFDVIEHIQEDELVLRNFHQALASSGGLLITVPQHQWLWSAADDYACHVRRYTRAELLEKLRGADFEVKYVSSMVSLLLPLMWASRRRRLSSNSDSMAEFNIPAGVNRLLDWVMRIELWLMRAGLTFPAGGSLIVYATKIA